MSYFIIYQGGINHVGVANLETEVLSAMEQDVSEITLCLCSGGGDVLSGIGLYNFLKMLPVRIHTHNLGLCGSVAATIYLAGERRTTAKASLFSLHAATFRDGPREGRLSEHTGMMSGPFKTELGWSDERIQVYFSSAEDAFIAPDQAKQLSLAHEVLDLKMTDRTRIVTVTVP